MYIGRDGGYGPILVDIDEMLEYFRFSGCCISAEHFRSYLQSFMIAVLFQLYYSPGPGVMSSYFI